MPGIREKVEAIANPLPKNIVPIANGDPAPPDLLIPMLSPQSATFRIIELGPLRNFGIHKNKSKVISPGRVSDERLLLDAQQTVPERPNQEAQFFR
jgi:hypothetical protein